MESTVKIFNSRTKYMYETDRNDLEVPVSSSGKCNLGKHSHLDPQSNPEGLKRLHGTGSSDLNDDNVLSKAPKIEPVNTPSTLGNFLLELEGSCQRWKVQEGPTYCVTIDDVRRAMDALMTSKDVVKSVPTSNDKSNLNHIKLNNKNPSDRGNRELSVNYQVPNEKSHNAQQPHIYFKDGQNRNNDHDSRTVHPQIANLNVQNAQPPLLCSKDGEIVIVPEHHSPIPSTSYSNPLLVLAQFTEGTSPVVGQAITINNTSVRNEIFGQHHGLTPHLPSMCEVSQTILNSTVSNPPSDKSKSKSIVEDNSSIIETNGKVIANSELQYKNYSIFVDIDNFLETEKTIHNLKVILECTSATLIETRNNTVYRCFFCRDHLPSPVHLKIHTLNHILKTKDMYSADKIVDIYQTFDVKLDITRLICTICKSEIKTINAAILHLKTVHRKGMYKMEFMTDDLPNETINIRSYKCRFCDKNVLDLGSHATEPSNHCNGLNRCQGPADTNVANDTKCHTGERLPQDTSVVYIGHGTDTTNRICEGSTGEAEVFNEVVTEGPIIGNTCRDQEYPIEDSVEMTENNDQCSDNIQTNENGELPIANGTKIFSNQTLYTLYFMTQEKHMYNIKTILECTNATLLLGAGAPRLSCLCYFCDDSFINPSDLKKHALNTHSIIKESFFKKIPVSQLLFLLDITDLCCKPCNEYIVSLESIISHLNDVHNKKLFDDIKNQILPFLFGNYLLICGVCFMSFSGLRNLFTHIHTHYKYYKCDKCDLGYINFDLLERHKRLCARTCGTCHTVFRSKFALENHVKSQECPLCNTKLPLTEEHVSAENISNTNRNIKPANVSVGSTNITVESQNISMEFPHKCHVCDKLFQTHNTLSKHVQNCVINRRTEMNSTFTYCVVPECKSTSKMTPNKMFITVPRNEQTRRKWLTLAYKQNANSISLDTKMYFCEDHFDLPNDMINYMEYSTGQVSKIRMKSGCTPTKFECQKGRINILEKRRMLSQAILANTPKVQKYPIKQSDKMSKNNDHCSNNIQTNKQEESQIANDKTLNSSTDHCKTTQDKHIYNIKTILECTNSSLIRIRGMLGCTCYFCDLDFENPLELKKHAINTHTVINEYCFTNTPLSQLLFLLDITDLRCIICSDNIHSLESIITHLNDVHNKKLFVDIKNQILPFKFYCNLLVCSKCSMKFVDHRKLVPHLHTHCKNYTCDKCDSGFAYPYALKRHCTTCHDVTCGICSMEFRNKLALNEHVNNCHEPWQYARAMDYSSSKNNCADKLPLAYKSNISSENPSFGPTNVSVEPICMRVDPPNITKPMDPPVSYDPIAVITNVVSGESLDIKMEERDAGPSTTEAGSVLCTVRQTVKATELTAQGSDRTPSQYCSETSNESIKNNVKIEDKQILVLKCDTCGGGFWDKKWRDIHVKWVHNDNTDVEKMLRCNTESYYNHSLRLRCTDLSEPSKHFFNISLLLRHTNATLIFSQEVFGCICYFCVRHYKTPSILKQHSSDEHSLIPRRQVYKSYYLRNIDKVDITGLRCKLCNYNFKTLETIKTHLEKFHDLHFYFETETRTVPVLFNNLTPLCCYCGVEFDNCQILAYHVMRNHYRKNICETCGLGFVTKKQIIRHTQVYNRVHGIFLCEVCLEPFDDYKTLKEHEDILHDKILKDSFSKEVHRSCNSRKDRKSKRQNAGFRNNPKRPTNVLGSLGHQSVPLNEFANTGIKNKIDTALSTKIIYCTNSAPFNSGKEITAGSEKIAVNGPQTTSVISKNISIAPQNMRAEIRQKCDACNMVFKTWDALSGHVKECTSFANCFSDEDEIVSQNKRAKHCNS